MVIFRQSTIEKLEQGVYMRSSCEFFQD